MLSSGVYKNMTTKVTVDECVRVSEYETSHFTESVSKKGPVKERLLKLVALWCRAWVKTIYSDHIPKLVSWHLQIRNTKQRLARLLCRSHNSSVEKVTHSSAMSNLYLIHHELDLHISRNRERVGDNYSLQNKTKPTNFLGRSRIRLGCKIATGRRRWRHGSKVQVEGRRERRPRPALSGSGQESRVRTLLGTNLDFAWKSSMRLINEPAYVVNEVIPVNGNESD